MPLDAMITRGLRQLIDEIAENKPYDIGTVKYGIHKAMVWHYRRQLRRLLLVQRMPKIPLERAAIYACDKVPEVAQAARMRLVGRTGGDISDIQKKETE